MALIIPMAIALAFSSVAAAGGGSTLKLFAKSSAKGLYTGNGAPVGLNAQPKPGDVFVNIGNVYVGTHASHSTKSAGSYKITCVLTTASGNSICNAKVNVSGSSFISKNVAVNLASNQPVRVTGGTGRYKGLQGFIASVPVGKTSNSDLTISYSH